MPIQQKDSLRSRPVTGAQTLLGEETSKVDAGSLPAISAYDYQFGPFRACALHLRKTKMAYQIAVIVGSLRRESTNRQLARALTSLAPADFSFDFVDIGTLPLYSQDYDADFPQVARDFKQKIEAADGLLFVTAEYNRSIPGVLKNALDLGLASLGQERVGRQAGRRRGHVARRDRYGAVAAASAQCAGLSRCGDTGPAGNVYQAQSGSHRRDRQDPQRRHPQG